MLIAGEASGDIHASGLIRAIKEIDTDASFRFFGGDLMAKEADTKPDVHYSELNVMGFSEVIRKLPAIVRRMKRAKTVMQEFRPDMLILIDFPGFNLKMARFASRMGIRTAFYISPKLWAWKGWRIKSIKKYVDEMFCILPFEIPFYKKHNYKNAVYVGNPSVAEIDHSLGHISPRRHFFERQGIEENDTPVIALLPGSRRGEIKNNLPLMISAAKRFPDYRYIVAAAPSVPEKYYREIAQDPGLKLAFGATHTLLKYSVAAIVTSGTATLETALIGTPQVVCYRANGLKISYKIMEKLLHVRHVSLPNLIVGNTIVPELLVHRCTPEAIAHELSPLLQPSPQRDWQLNGYKLMRRKLGTNIAADYAARLICENIHPGETRSDSGNKIV